MKMHALEALRQMAVNAWTPGKFFHPHTLKSVTNHCHSSGPPSDSKGDDPNVNTGSNLFVTGIHPRLTEADITRLFEKYGDVASCNIMRDPHSGDSRGFGFVRMVSSEQADAARDGLQGQTHEGRTLSIEKARRGRPRTPTPGKYYGPPKRGLLSIRPPAKMNTALRDKIRVLGPTAMSLPPWQRGSHFVAPMWKPPPFWERRVNDPKGKRKADDCTETRGFRGGRFGGDRYEDRRGGGYGRRDDYEDRRGGGYGRRDDYSSGARGGRERYRDRYDDREYYGGRYGTNYRDREDYGRGVDRYASGPQPRGEDRYGGSGRGDDRRGYYPGREDRAFGEAPPRDGAREPFAGGGRGYDDRGEGSSSRRD